jgi:POT family proton-dependent oligopeptide transporter
MDETIQAQEQLTQDIADTPARNPIIRFLKSHPKGFWFFFWGEFAERCSYYGMRAILARYMADQLALGQDNSAAYVSYFIAACYFLPLLGGWVADRFFGKYWTIVGFSLPYIVGQLLLTIESIPFMVISLVLLAMGSGVIKPNISTLMGLTYDQQRPGQTKLRSDGFAIFYFSINVGAALASFSMPLLRDAHGYAIAFLFPAGLMVLAFLIFAAGKPYYAVETVGQKLQMTPEQKAERRRVLGRVAGLFFLVMFFWAIFDQASTTWIFFAQACMDNTLFGKPVAPDQIQAFNPVFILILLPLITVFLKYLDGRGIKIRPTGKMVLGFLLTAGCMGIMALAAALAGEAERRPGIIEGKDLRLEVKDARGKSVLIEGALRIDSPGDNSVSVHRETRIEEKGRPRVVKENWKLSGTGVLKLVPVGSAEDEKSPRTVAVEGDITKFEKALEDEQTESLLEGKVAARVEGKMREDQRWFVSAEHRVTVWWQVLAYLIITIAEVLISVTGLELGYTAAPKAMSGFVTAMWLSTVGLANLFINAPVTQLYTRMQPSAYFGMLALVLLAVTVAFVPVARRFNRHSQEGAAVQ